jgi:hypothetical protein
MSAVALSGSDTIVINGYLFVDLADENVVELTFPSDIAQVKTGKNGNSIYGLNETGKQCEMKLRVLRGGADDQFLNNLLIQQQANFAGTVLMQGTFIKKIGDGQGNITSDTYVMSGGVFTKQVEGKSNVAGDTEQSIAIYMIKFSNSPRAIT